MQFGAWLLLLAALAAGVARGDERPDVLFIAVDDLNDWVGVLGGHPQVRTPHIDRLAARGMTFTNAHSPSALCNPSRTALLTGLRPSTSGVYGNDPDWRQFDRFGGLATLPRHFRDGGYRTLGAGKIFHAHTFAAAAFSGYNDPSAWDAFYPSLERQLPDELAPPLRPANLYPTLAELAGLGVPEHVEGQSLVPLLRDTASPRAEPALMTYGFGNHAVRDERYRYIRYVDGSEELYDHRIDPHEWTNLAERPEHAGTKAALAQFMPRADTPPIGGAGSD